MYAQATKILKKVLDVDTIYKIGFNWSPMYRRSVGKLIYISKDMYEIKVKIPLNYKNRNYAGTIFGGSLFSATDPIYMIQLIEILGRNYIVWDKDAEIKYKRPARSTAFADFKFSESEIKKIKEEVKINGEFNLIKTLNITNEDSSIVFANLKKTIYIADKTYYAQKKKK
ncbi:DUF4442 domain-containing protein [Urechidicola croceus]|uniref:DUF4442 domain-containing protein n=1 Tax=Urechidicola croceus TaxID=1850246 RepID=A0A1D8P5Y8_9FLAO|nr:DUF4442 domain-containing protein [Urechidicola croceus]AOW19984.1 DUF4442 domain-containing protein [Urechidicola croceus]